MACKTASCWSWKLHHVDGNDEPLEPNFNSSDEIGDLTPTEVTGLALVKELHAGLGGNFDRVSITLRAAVLHLETPREDSELSPDEAREMVACFIITDIPARLVESLAKLDFEARKDAARVFSAFLRLATTLEVDGQVVEYMRARSQIFQQLLEGCGRLDVLTHCAPMLRCYVRHPQLAAVALEEKAFTALFELAKHPSFDISCEAFCTLREMLFSQRAVSAGYIKSNLREFFAMYHTLLLDQTYVTQRQALRLLGEVLLNRSFTEVMLFYVSSNRFLEIHMNFLRDRSSAIQLEAFHVFKIFVANPHKPHRVQLILFRNKERLLKLLETFHGKKQGDDFFAQDLQTIMKVLREVEPPVKATPQSPTVAQA